MRPTNFAKANTVYKGNKDANVSDLPCFVDRVEEAGPHDGAQRSVTSVWRPTEDERRQIAAGANIALCLYTPERIPPVLLITTAEGIGSEWEEDDD